MLRPQALTTAFGQLFIGCNVVAATLFVLLTTILIALTRIDERPVLKDYATFCGAAASHSILNVAVFAEVGGAGKAVLMHLIWLVLTVSYRSYAVAVAGFLGNPSRHTRWISAVCTAVGIVVCISLISFVTRGEAIVLAPVGDKPLSLLWELHGMRHQPSRFGSVVAGSTIPIILWTVVINWRWNEREVGDRFVRAGLICTIAAAALTVVIVVLRLKIFPVIFAANIIEALRITYVEARRVVDRAARLDQERAHQEARVAEQMERLHGLAKVGELSSSLRHELKNPMSAALLSVQLAASRAAEANVQQPLTHAETALRHLDDLVRGMGVASPRELPPTTHNDVGELLETAAGIAGHRMHEIDCELTVEIPPDQLVRGRSSELVQVFINLLTNACDAVADLDERWIRISSRRREGAVELRFSDSGKIPAPEVRADMFQAFFTSKTGDHSGIGLTICKQIIERLGGSIRVDAEATHTTFVVRFPPAPGPTNRSIPLASDVEVNAA